MKREYNCISEDADLSDSEPMVVITVHFPENTCTPAIDALQEYMIASWPYRTLRTGTIAKSGSIIVRAFAKVI